ncbi:hypothetical protein BPADB04_24810 [Bacillus paranthracis]|uniref:hypothetical protein n=1 Tax=Bacillus paranthracis TaxID=2026186 RepID=UPI001C80B0B6|nr:hypothetical protein [Bacillus paranthracis]GIX57451.1 hypothetical protein BPADB04_24810 [Bacillus paranthracis]
MFTFSPQFAFYDLKRSQYNSGVKKNKHLNDTLYEGKIKMRKVYLAALHNAVNQYNSGVIDEITKNKTKNEMEIN